MNDIKRAIEVFDNGGIVIFPSDTAFGIGCRMDREESVQKLFRLRRRPPNQATPILVSSKQMALNYWTSVSQDSLCLLDQYWPGALTIVNKCLVDKVPFLVRGQTDSLGIRMPNHQELLLLIETLGCPILGPSANFHGEPTPYEFSDLDPKLIEMADFVLPGNCSTKLASTVIDVGTHPWKIIRQGPVIIKGVSQI